jgi:mono/diheme cytochrome c family protein
MLSFGHPVSASDAWRHFSLARGWKASLILRLSPSVKGLVVAIAIGAWLGNQGGIFLNQGAAIDPPKSRGDRPQRPARSASAPELVQADDAVSRGSSLFRRHCISCHGKDGNGAKVREDMEAIPDFTNALWQQRKRDGQLIVSILEGRGTFMPAFNGRFNRQQVADLVAFIRAFTTGRPVSGSNPPDDFEAQFQKLLKEHEKLRKQIQELSQPAEDRQAKDGPKGGQ